MIVIMARFPVRPEHAQAWPQITADFTAAVRAEPGCLWFDWSRSLDDGDEYVLLEAFADDDAAAAHVGSEHFAAAQRDLPPYLSATPRVVNTTADGDGWSLLGEMSVDGASLRIAPPTAEAPVEREGRSVVPATGTSIDDGSVQDLRDADQR